MLRKPSPGETTNYIDGVAERFRQYVEQSILPRLNSSEISADQRLTGLNYLRVHRLKEHNNALLEILTTRYKGSEALPLYRAALKTAQASELELPKLVKGLVSVMISDPHTARDALYARQLKNIGKPAGVVMLDMLRPSLSPKGRRLLVRKISEVTGVKWPQDRKTWIQADDDQLKSLVREWESQIDPDGSMRRELETKPQPDATPSKTDEDKPPLFGSGVE